MDRRAGLYTALLAGLGAAGSAIQYPYYQRGHASPRRQRIWRQLTGGGKRQGARLARQMAAGQLDFSASERCIERIKAKRA